MHDSDHSWAEQHKGATQTKIARDVRNTQQVLRNIAQRSCYWWSITEEYCHICDCITIVGTWENASWRQGRQDSGRHTFQKRPSYVNECNINYKGWWIACPCGSQTSPSKAACPRMITERCIWSWTTQTSTSFIWVNPLPGTC